MSIKINIVPSSGSIEEVDKDGKLSDRERRARLFPGYDQLKSLSLGIVEQTKDFSNCKTKELDKKYKVDKGTGKRSVELDQKLDCSYVSPEPVKIDPKKIERWKKLAAIQKKYDNSQEVRIAKPMFDRFMSWLDQQ
jgi:hypothetical protein